MALVSRPKRLEFEQGSVDVEPVYPNIAIMIFRLGKIRVGELFNLKTMTCNSPLLFLALLARPIPSL
jgi:hypothetical protein